MSSSSVQLQAEYKEEFDRIVGLGDKAFEVGFLIGSCSSLAVKGRKNSQNTKTTVSTLVKCPDFIISLGQFGLYAKEVVKRIPGGLQIVGLYVYKGKDASTPRETELLEEVFSAVANLHYPALRSFILLHLSDFSGVEALRFQPAEDQSCLESKSERMDIKYDNYAKSGLSSVRSALGMSFSSLAKDLSLNGSAAFKTTLLNEFVGRMTRIITKESFLSGSVLFDPDSKRPVSDDTVLSPGSEVYVDFFVPSSSPLRKFSGTGLNSFSFSGNVEVFARVTGAVTGADVKAALIEDVIRSLRLRTTVFQESCGVDECVVEEEETKAMNAATLKNIDDFISESFDGEPSGFPKRQVINVQVMAGMREYETVKKDESKVETEAEIGIEEDLDMSKPTNDASRSANGLGPVPLIAGILILILAFLLAFLSS
mmetsp:Transcript_18062/g.23596  ORF Transcript_18062/g.23596 Transcript_18062/m.23596 type:complete len:427 (-) Transcript_18062:510-1790(-)|eukprot:CAMPEP_0184012772 /NCGR_PEP_ID=MMETSP0954-20121128/4626_1 /TAXON_ID=627963 /ORGANISM="Aplanochytrium sp, Strain PBS07" /LENGTH=426 /DNA_ID=CAMNT_0026292853 /DNA_START=43 /DNA_END=1323 /DNA_ORIENTATION=-